MPLLLQVALGGAIGASLRYLVTSNMTRALGLGFPYGTLTVNILGSFIMGAFASWVALRGTGSWQHAAPFLMTGILGGFTTFSAFSLETILLIERGEMRLAGLYVAASVVLSVGALFAGLSLTRAVLS